MGAVRCFPDLQKLDERASAPVLARFSEHLVSPFDRFVTRGERCVPETCEVQYLDSGDCSAATPNNLEVKDCKDCNMDLEEAKALPGEPKASTFRHALQGVYLTVAAGIIIASYYLHLFAATSDLGAPTPLTCHSSFLRYSTVLGGSECGLWGEECMPTEQWMPIRCPGMCGEGIQDPLIGRVIGSTVYRADSRICVAALHAGHIGFAGGCVDVRLAGAQSSFPATRQSGLESVAFDSWYPFSMEFRTSAGARNCGFDHTPILLMLNLILLAGFLLLRPSKRLFFWAMISSTWWYCALISPLANRTVAVCFTFLGRFAYFVFGAEVLLWRVGHAKCTFPDTSSRASTLHVIFIELLPLALTLHWHFLSTFAGYSLNGALFQSWEGPMAFLIGLLVLMPLAIGVLRDWFRARLLRFVLKQLFFTAVAIVGLTLIFSTSGWGLHLHHYFVALVCYLASRGGSKCSAVARALCVGALINGLSHWGETSQIPIWAEGAGWYPPSGSIDSAAWGSADQVIFTAAERVNHSEEILLRWSFVKDLTTFNCSTEQLQQVQDNAVFVVEMNHIEIYRGKRRWVQFTPTAPRVFVRVARVGYGLSRQVVSATQVLALKQGPEALAWPYDDADDDCKRATTIIQQPSWTLDGFV